MDTVNWFLRLHTPDTVSWFCCGLCSVKHAYRTCRRGSGQTADGLLSAITKLTQNHLFLTIPLSRCIPLRTPCINAYDGVYHMLISCVCTKQLRLSTELIEAQLPPLSANVGSLITIRLVVRPPLWLSGRRIRSHLLCLFTCKSVVNKYYFDAVLSISA